MRHLGPGSAPAHRETPSLILTETACLHGGEHPHRDVGGDPSPERGRRERRLGTPLLYATLASQHAAVLGRSRPPWGG